MKSLREPLARVARLATEQKDAEAADLMEKSVDPIFEEVSASAQAIFAWIDNETKNGTASLAASADATIKLTIALMGVGLAIGLAGAFLIAQFGIVRPIHALVGCMDVLAQGKYDVEVPGSARKD
jgi:methyl-accepting chemotaxis protein